MTDPPARAREQPVARVVADRWNEPDGISHAKTPDPIAMMHQIACRSIQRANWQGNRPKPRPAASRCEEPRAERVYQDHVPDGRRAKRKPEPAGAGD